MMIKVAVNETIANDAGGTRSVSTPDIADASYQTAFVNYIAALVSEPTRLSLQD